MVVPSIRFGIAFLFAAFSALLPQAPRAGNLELTQSVSLLAGRLTIKLPLGAEPDPRSVGIMSAKPAQEEETRIVLPVGGGRLVIFFKETYRLVPPGSDEKLKADLQQEKPDAQPSVFEVGKTRVWLQAPVKWAEVINGGELVEHALIVLPDQTVVIASFYVSLKHPQRDQLRLLVRQSLRTLTFQHDLVIGGKFDVAGIVVPLPIGWTHSEQQGPDFSVHRFRKLSPWGTTSPSSIGLYEGGHATYQHDQGGTKTSFTTQKGKWLGRDVTWHIAQDESKMREAIVEVKPGVRHIWYYGSDAQTVIDAMTLR